MDPRPASPFKSFAKRGDVDQRFRALIHENIECVLVYTFQYMPDLFGVSHGRVCSLPKRDNILDITTVALLPLFNLVGEVLKDLGGAVGSAAEELFKHRIESFPTR